MRTTRLDGWLTAIVLGHLMLNIFHGRAHDGGHVAITQAQALFVYVVILAAPLVGLGASFVHKRLGAAIVAVAMGASLLFGLINHFVIISPDHVSQVAPEWRSSFTVSAILLVVSEAAGLAAGLRGALGREVLS